MTDLLKQEDKKEPDCEHCGDSGFIFEDEVDEDGNIRRGVDIRECPFCKINEN